MGVVVFLLILGGMIYGVVRLHGAVLQKMQAAAAEAARAFNLEAVSLPREDAAYLFGFEGPQVHSDVALFRGDVQGVEVLMGAFNHDSRTAMNGVPIPITTTQIMVKHPQALKGQLEMSRRVFGMGPSSCSISKEFDDAVVLTTDQPDAVKRALADPQLQREIMKFLNDGQGSAFLYGDSAIALAFHPSPDKIRHALRGVVSVSKMFSKRLGDETPLR